MNKTIYCPMCEEERAARAETVREEYELRGEKIALDVPRLICLTCGELVIDEAYGDPTLRLYAEYRRRHNLLTPDQIRGIRDKYDLSQEAFAILLGTSPATLARYEGGSVQEKAYDQLLRACYNPVVVAELLEREGPALSDLQRRNVTAALNRVRQTAALAAIPGCRELSLAKYTAVVVWFCRHLHSIPQTKICKLLFYADFLHFQAFGRSLTGSNYRRLAYGPVPCAYEALRTILEENDAIEVQSIVYPAGYDGLEYRIGSAAANNPDVFTQDESRVLDFVATTFGRLNAKEISDRSHKETAWTKTPAKELISYHHAQHLSVRLPAR
jgi:putative zinc finger/helix-turn-helix YgiT family protein